MPDWDCNVQFSWVSLGEVLRTSAGLFTAWVAYSAYSMGKTYFERGQENSLAIADYNKLLDVLNEVKSQIVELHRLTLKLLDIETPQVSIETILTSMANTHADADRALKAAQFVDGLDNIRSNYLAWNEKWFIDPDQAGLVPNLLDESKRQKTTDQIRGNLLGEISAILKDIEAARLHVRPIVKLGK